MTARVLLPALLLVACADCASAPPRHAMPVGYLLVAPDVLDLLEGRANATDNETALCLLGERKALAVQVTGFIETPITKADRMSVRFDRCDNADYVGVYHSHPAETGDNCIPSPRDMRRFYRDGPALVDLVSCGRGENLTWGYVLKGSAHFYALNR